MVESAVTFPVIALLTLALVNLAIAGYAHVTASNAANYAARAASVDQANPAGSALAAAGHALQGAIGTYEVSVSASNWPGGMVVVTVDWEVPNFFGGLLTLFGESVDDVLEGQATSAFRKEGW